MSHEPRFTRQGMPVRAKMSAAPLGMGEPAAQGVSPEPPDDRNWELIDTYFGPNAFSDCYSAAQSLDGRKWEASGCGLDAKGEGVTLWGIPRQPLRQ